ncbi:LysR family transcriptional regulator, partial [Carnobacterium jeotgali]
MKLDIAQLNYFIAIVDANLNLTLAAQNIHVTQSALSQFIINFEKEESLQLFHRKNGRLTGLTTSGEKLYDQALEIVGKHENLHEMLRQEAQIQEGIVRLGISTIILRLF